MNWQKAADVKKTLRAISKALAMDHVDPRRIICFRSFGAKSRARARIWSLPRIWQDALGVEAHYVIEVLAEKFDRLSQADREKVIIHELLHIPKNFSGALRPHKARNWRLDHRMVDRLHKSYQNLNSNP